MTTLSVHHADALRLVTVRKTHAVLVGIVCRVACVMLGGTNPAVAATVSGISVHQTDFVGGMSPPVLASEWGDVDLFFHPGSDPFWGYFQMVVSTGGPPIWAIRNMPVPANADLTEPVTISRFFDLGVPRGTPLTTILVGFTVTPTTIDAPPVVFLDTVAVTPRPYTVSLGVAEGGTSAPINPGAAPVPDPVTTPGLVVGTKILHADVPDVEEGINECGPGAYTRSLLWLKNRGDIPLTKTTDTLMNELKTSSSWNAVDGIPTYADSLKAKLAITKNLDMNNKFMVRRPSSVPAGDYETSDGKAINKGDDPTFEFIKKELAANEDVEIIVGWMDGGVRRSGHVMTVVGLTDDPTSGIKEITVQDDAGQATTNSRNQRRLTRFADKTTTQPPRLLDLPNNRVEMVISESPKPKVTTGTATTSTSLQLSFNGPMGPSALLPGNYSVSGPGKGTVAVNPASVGHVGGNTYELSWAAGAMVAGAPVTVSVSDAVHDTGDNPVGDFHIVTIIAVPVGLTRFGLD
ncbi:MAG: hypothetical protein N2111_10120 [Candidatus Sumerlaeaceae bacterium]|nr:hypothetical protein [Candidatus Sumerlaeaceae bacterium]